MAYSRRKIRTKRSRKSRRNKRTRSYKKGGYEFNKPTIVVRSSDAYEEKEKPNYSPRVKGDGEFNFVARQDPFITVGNGWSLSNNHITMNTR